MTENTEAQDISGQEGDIISDLYGEFSENVAPQLDRLNLLWMLIAGNSGDLISGGWHDDLGKSAMNGLDEILTDICGGLKKFKAELDQAYEPFSKEKIERIKGLTSEENEKTYTVDMIVQLTQRLSPENRAKVFEQIGVIKGAAESTESG